MKSIKNAKVTFQRAAIDSPSYKHLVLERLRRAIIVGQLPAGTKLPQDMIAAEFGVSRMPVREALLQLQAEGLVDFPRHRIAVVSSLSLEEVAEIFEVRGMVESRAVELGVPKLSEANIVALEAAHKTMWTRRGRAGAWLALNRRFHSITYEASGRRHMCRIIDAVQDNLDRYLSLYLNTLDTFAKAHNEHAAILDACRSRNGQLAAELTYRHIADTADAILAHIKEQRERSEASVSSA